MPSRSAVPEISSDWDPEPWEVPVTGKKVVIGLGNPYMKDDGVGLVAAEEIRKLDLSDVVVFNCASLDLALLWEFREASKVVIVDALKSGSKPCTVISYSIDPLGEPLEQLPSLHTLQPYDVVDLASQVVSDLGPVRVVGIEPKDCSPGEGLTREVANAVPRLIEAVRRELGDSEETE